MDEQNLCLDFGCGEGRRDEISDDRKSLICWLDDNGGENTIGIDIDSDAIDKIKNRVRNGTQFYHLNGCKMPFNDNTFKLIHEHGVLHHIHNYSEAIIEISRVLKPGGIFLLKETVSNDPVYQFARVVHRSWRECKIESYFTTEDLQRKLSAYFNIISVQYYWRFILSDILLEHGLEGSRSLRFNLFVNKLWSKLRLAKHTCCHCVIRAEKK